MYRTTSTTRMNSESNQSESNAFISIHRNRQSRGSDSDESEIENASKFQKIDLNYWIYLKPEEQNFANLP